MKRLVRWSVRGLLLVLLVVAGLWGYAEGRQWLLRIRAERLLADLQRLQVQRSSWADLQKVMNRWGRWGSYNGSCNADHCLYGVMLDNKFPAVMYVEDQGFDRLRAERLWSALGFRRVSVVAGFDLHSGVIVEKSFVLDIDLPVSSTATRYLTVISDEGPRVVDTGEDDRAIHPYRSLTGGKYFIVMATPKEDAEEKAKLMRFHLDCITALHPCEDRRRLLPEAYGELEAQAENVKQLEKTPCALPYWVIARDERTVLIADVVSARRETKLSDGTATDPYWVISIRPEQMLKGKLYVPMAKLFYVDLSDETVKARGYAAFPSKLVVSGRPEDNPSGFDEPIATDDCRIVAATPANLAEAKHGVSEDYSPYHY